MDTLIVMDHVIGLADNSNDFANFLIVARKFGYSCVYIFHIIYSEKVNCEMNLSQTKIINIFPAWIEQSIALKIISDNCSCKTLSYNPNKELWLNRIFMKLSRKKEKNYITINCTGDNPNRPRKFRTNPNNENEQICYFNEKTKDST